MSVPSFRPAHGRRRRPSSRTSRGSGDPGQALPLVLLCAVVAIAIALLVAHQGRVATDRARARTAADAAALAAAGQDDTAARMVAERNGATVVDIRRVGSQVEVSVRLGDVQATSRAGRSG